MQHRPSRPLALIALFSAGCAPPEGTEDTAAPLAFDDGDAARLVSTPTWDRGDTAVGLYGRSAAHADFNRDGWEDLVVNQADGVRVDVFLNLGTAPWYASTPSTSFNGPSAVGGYGAQAIVATGDFNGNGVPDLAVSNRAHGALGSHAGVVKVYEYIGTSFTETASVGFAIPDLWFGCSIATGRANNDTFDDLVVGACQRYTFSGGWGGALPRSYVLYGSSSGLTTAGAAVSGVFGVFDRSGYGNAVAVVPDMNRDGYGEFAVAAPGRSFNATGEGVVYYQPFSATGASYSTTASLTRSVSVANAEFGGSVADDWSPYGVSGGDVDGDGVGDIVVGASGLGGIEIFWGDGVGGTVGPASYGGSASFGYAVNAACDINGDGRDDVLVGAPDAPSGGNVRLYYGTANRSPALDMSWSPTITGATRFGAYVGCAGDVDKDTRDDALVQYTDTAGKGHLALYLSSQPEADADNDGAADLLDCRPTDPTVYPGATEKIADGTDQNCDGKEQCYGTDADNDTYGAVVITSSDSDCTDPGELTKGGDCNDASSAIRPGVVELVGDEVDQNCDKTELCYKDTDADTFCGSDTVASTVDLLCNGASECKTATDCEDAIASIHPGAVEVVADGVDGDCNNFETCYSDDDKDAHGTATLRPSSDLDCTDPNESSVSDDCDDTDAAVYAGAPEILADSIDQDCDGEESCYADTDGDGAGAGYVTSADADCTDPGESMIVGDCDDTDKLAAPGLTEIAGNGKDDDCDGGLELCYVDADGDGYGGTATVESAKLDCSEPGKTSKGADCDDEDDTRYPGADENVGNSLDEDCDGFDDCYADADGDGFGSDVATVSNADQDCDDPGESVLAGGVDCDDANTDVHPGAAEGTADGWDADCDGKEMCWADADGDGEAGSTALSDDLSCDGANEYWAGGDCDDDDVTVNTLVDEATGTGVDQNCDGAAPCFADDDGDGFGIDDVVQSAPGTCEGAGIAVTSDDCDDADVTRNPAAEEACNGRDDDCNDVIDDPFFYAQDGGSCTEDEVPNLCGCQSTGGVDGVGILGTFGLLIAASLRRRRGL